MLFRSMPKGGSVFFHQSLLVLHFCLAIYFLRFMSELKWQALKRLSDIVCSIVCAQTEQKYTVFPGEYIMSSDLTTRWIILLLSRILLCRLWSLGMERSDQFNTVVKTNHPVVSYLINFGYGEFLYLK